MPTVFPQVLHRRPHVSNVFQGAAKPRRRRRANDQPPVYPVWPKYSCGTSVELQQASEPLVAVDPLALWLDQRRQ